MDYELIVSERADELIDRLASYLLNNLKNPGAAAHFLDELESIYDRLTDNPFQFPDSPDEYLFIRGYIVKHCSKRCSTRLFTALTTRES